MESGDAKNTFGNQRKQIEVPEIGAIEQSLVQYFGDIKDPRVERIKKHLLTDILASAILAIIAKAQGWEDIENYGISKKQCERQRSLPKGAKPLRLVISNGFYSVRQGVERRHSLMRVRIKMNLISLR